MWGQMKLNQDVYVNTFKSSVKCAKKVSSGPTYLNSAFFSRSRLAIITFIDVIETHECINC